MPKLLALSQVVADPQAFGLQLWSIDDTPYLDKVDVGPQTSLARVAAMADMSGAELKYFNACLKDGVTPPTASFALLLPRDKALVLQQRLPKVPEALDAHDYFARRSDTPFEMVRH